MDKRIAKVRRSGGVDRSPPFAIVESDTREEGKNRSASGLAGTRIEEPKIPKVTTETTIGRTCVELEAEAYEHEAKAATLRAEAVRARAMELHRQHAPSIAKAPVHMTRGEYAQRSRVSDATVSRWAKQGMPTIPVGTTDRIDPAGADEWRRSRPRVATTPTKKTLAANDDALDVSASLSSAGIERGHAS